MLHCHFSNCTEQASKWILPPVASSTLRIPKITAIFILHLRLGFQYDLQGRLIAMPNATIGPGQVAQQNQFPTVNIPVHAQVRRPAVNNGKNGN